MAAASNPEAAGWRRPPATADQLRSDAFSALGLFLVGVMSFVLVHAIGSHGAAAAAPIVSIVMIAAITLTLAVRRRFPSVVAVVVTIAFIVGAELGMEETIVANIALFCAIYTVGAWEPNRRRALWIRIVSIGLMTLWLVVLVFRISTMDLGTGGAGIGVLTPNLAFILQNVLVNALYFAGAYWFGETAWNAARQRALVELRTAQLAAERDRVGQQAVTIERLRIARELHDAVAHHVSLMGVQAAAARAVLPGDVDGARAQLVALEDSARSAVGELYSLLGTLRDDDQPAERQSAEFLVGLDGLPALVAESQSAGLQAELTEIGEPADVPPLVGLNLYRIAQEALTNVLKHAGPGTAVTIRVRYLSDDIELEVADDGAGRAARADGGAGLGLPGMRERVSSLGGELVAAPRSTGGFVVRAAVPLTVRHSHEAPPGRAR